MRRALRAKFETHVDARELLLSTGDEPLLEDSRTTFCGASGATEAARTGSACCSWNCAQLRSEHSPTD